MSLGGIRSKIYSFIFDLSVEDRLKEGYHLSGQGMGIRKIIKKNKNTSENNKQKHRVAVEGSSGEY